MTNNYMIILSNLYDSSLDPPLRFRIIVIVYANTLDYLARGRFKRFLVNKLKQKSVD